MRQIFASIIIGGLFLLCSSCSTTQYQVLFKQHNASSDTAYQTNDTLKEYRIKPQDVLQVRNLQDANALIYNGGSATNGTSGVKSTIVGAPNSDNQVFQVDQDGNVILPAIGSVKVAGYTRMEAQQIVENEYKKQVFNNPIIELKIVSLKVTIFGEAKGQGSFPLTKEHMTLVEMIGQAGGLTDRADEKHIKIIRGTEKNPKVISVDLSDIYSINDPKAVLQNGDIVYVSLNTRAVRNENFQNFSTSWFQPVLLVFNTALIIFTFIHR